MAERPLLRVKCFRGVKEAELELAPITIITGRNNAGKSSLLEAAAVAFTAPVHRLQLAEPGDAIGCIVVRKQLQGYGELVNDGCEKALIEAKYGRLLFRTRLLHPRRSWEAALFLAYETFTYARDGLEECLVQEAKGSDYVAAARLAAALAALFIDYLLLRAYDGYLQGKNTPLYPSKLYPKLY
ncbi:AAA family ATPase [Pyrodictium abyssi]|uniref:Endonuclease GajA/Old nuclease/RecF-like AAA domain-containing protein n=1 Tax=Pyrodictium abyssi TaxID=54256 RepID=A0ABN6ZRD3_9CREN|nr:hypothetical protein PABY_23400 [Pyrodictium abyssi]